MQLLVDPFEEFAGAASARLLLEKRGAPFSGLGLGFARAKMREWTANGVLLAWLMNPDSRSVEIYRAGVPSKT